MRMVWKKFVQNHRGNFIAELKLKTDTYWMLLCTFIYFIIYLYGYLMIYIILKCTRQAQGNNLCAHYIMENIHGLVGPHKTYILGRWK